VNQFRAKHKCLPKQIVVHPVALAALAVKQSVATKWQGIPVTCREIKAPPLGQTKYLATVDDSNFRLERKADPVLGVTVINGTLRGFDL